MSILKKILESQFREDSYDTYRDLRNEGMSDSEIEDFISKKRAKYRSDMNSDENREIARRNREFDKQKNKEKSEKRNFEKNKFEEEFEDKKRFLTNYIRKNFPNIFSNVEGDIITDYFFNPINIKTNQVDSTKTEIKELEKSFNSEVKGKLEYFVNNILFKGYDFIPKYEFNLVGRYKGFDEYNDNKMTYNIETKKR